MKTIDTTKQAKVFKALSHPNRLELFLEIMRKQEASYEADCRECFVSDIMESLNIGAPTVSHHLKELANAELIIPERRGKFLIARVNWETLKAIRALLAPEK